MSNQHELQPSDEISLKELVLKLREWGQYLLKNKRIILASMVFCAIVGLVYALITKPKYKAEITFVLEEDKGSSGGSLLSLASQFGLSAGGASGGLFAGENIMYLMKSDAMLRKTLLTKVRVGEKHELLVDKYIEYNHLREKWADSPEMKSLSFSVDEKQFNRLQNKILDGFCATIAKKNLKTEKADKKLSIMSVSYEGPDEVFSKLFIEALVENVTKFYVATKTQKYASNLALLQKKADSLQVRLNSNILGVAQSSDRNPNAVLAQAQAPSKRRQIDLQIITTAYTEVVKNIENMKFLIQKETPLIQAIDTPVFPLPEKKPSPILMVLVGLFLGAFLSSFAIIIRKIFIDMMKG